MRGMLSQLKSRQRVLCRQGLATGFVLLSLLAIGPSGANAATSYDVKATWGDTYLPPGGEGQFTVQVRNIGAENGTGELKVTDELPEGVTATHVAIPFGALGDLTESGFVSCSGLSTETVECIFSSFATEILIQAPSIKKTNGIGVGGFGAEQPSGYVPTVMIDVAIDAGAAGTGTNTATVSGGGAVQPANDVDQVPFSATPSVFGLVAGSYVADVFDQAYPAGSPVRQAGTHPFEQRVNFDLNGQSKIGEDGTRFTSSHGTVKTAEVTLPRGFIGNPEATPKCDPVDFAQEGSTLDSTGCPSNTQVGYLNVSMTAGQKAYGEPPPFYIANETLAHVPIYNLKPPKGVPADFGFNAGTFVQAHIYPTLDPSQDYAIKTVTPNISSLVSVRGSEVVFWGVPGDPIHDFFRYYPETQENEDVAGAAFGGAPIRPFFTTPMDCGFDNGGARIRLDSYTRPGEFTPVEEYANPLNVEGCDDPRFRFEPKISLEPSDQHAGAPTGLDVHLEVPQRNDEVTDAKELYAENGSVKGISTPPLKKAVVTLPEGMTLSPSAAQGLGSCSSAQIGLVSTSPIRFNDAPVDCPNNSQYGKLIIHTPILPVNEQPEGFIYIAKQGDNPFHNFLSVYLVVEEPNRGILVKVPGKIDLNPQTGQITTTFDDLPQFPISDTQMTFKGGTRAGLVEPSTCGHKAIHAEFFTWQDPQTAHIVDSSYDITQKPDGSSCPNSLGERPFKPSLEAGTINNAGGSYSPFTFRLTRTDDDQEFSRVGVKLPPGLAAKFAGVSICSDAAIARAASRTGAGDGGLEQLDPSCPQSSQIGTTDVGAGVGVPLTFVPGKIYLAGPYRGAPISMAVITPAVVGPFDLGVITVRTALNVDPETAQGSASSDPFPQIFQGIPVRIRDIRLNLDRHGFTLNPTSCAVKQIEAHVTGTGGDVFSAADDTGADLTNRFQAADCASLGFRPQLAFRLSGGTRRGDHPRLKAVVTYPRKGAYANVARASVALPRSEFLDQAHIKTICTRVQFAGKACPAGSVYGHAVAKTPLFDAPLEGPVYLRSSSHKLPDLVAVLKGPASQPVEVDLDGRIDSIHGGIRNTFEVVPDAPVESFTLTMKGAKKGLLVNSANLCAETSHATARFTAQNGKTLALHPPMRNSCGKSGHHRKPGTPKKR